MLRETATNPAGAASATAHRCRRSRGLETDAPRQPGDVSFTAWAGDVARLCTLIAGLEPLAAELGVSPSSEADWRGALFGKLRPQVCRDPLMVAAVCGGTNTGKSLITNSLVGAEISRSLPEAARTLHPVASLPRGTADRIDVAALFPGFRPVPWRSDADALEAAADHPLVWREDPSGRQPERLIILDTPDIDGTLRENWRRAELVRDACDVLVAVLTQQKYNDAAVRDFFAAAAAADKTVIVVVNMVDWPRQRVRLPGWLATFAAGTGVEPAAVYAAPHDFAAAEAGRIEILPIGELTADGREVPLTERLARLDFERIKRRAMRGALRLVLDPHRGVASWLDAIGREAAVWESSRRLLEDQVRVRVELPAAPREIVWNEIWDWLEPRRFGVDLAVSRLYRAAGGGIRWAARKAGLMRTPTERREDFTGRELEKLKEALGDFVDRLDDACSRDPRLAAVLGRRLATADRTAWFADLEGRHAALPLVSEDYRRFVRGELDRFARDNPAMTRAILGGLTVGSVARPVLTLALFGAGAAVVPAAAGAAGGLSMLVHHVIDVGASVAVPLAGEGAVAAAAGGVRLLVERLFAGWAAERGRILADTLHDVVLGDGLEEIGRRASAGARPDLAEARRALAACGREAC